MSKTFLAVDNVASWPLEIPGVEIVSAAAYVSDARYAELPRATVFNLCRAYGYQTLGYYVSLLALARGHRALPEVTTLQDLRIPHVARSASEDLEELIERALAEIKDARFTLFIYFGRDAARRNDRLARAIFNHFPAPLLRAHFLRDEEGEWELERVRPIAVGDVPDADHDLIADCASRYLARPNRRAARPVRRYDLAILVNPEEEEPPSDETALKKFVEAAEELDMEAELIEPEDYPHIAEYDALFLRETTSVAHHTYRFARRAQSEGLVVLDHPDSIVRCTNKVFLAELFSQHKIPCPRTLIVDDDDVDAIVREVGLPCVLKEPDSSFSQGVVKVQDFEDLRRRLPEILARSELAVAQEFTPSEFDWRIGVLEGSPLYACRYFMARGHWQIIAKTKRGRRYGRIDPVALADVPPRIVEIALRAARLIGDGLYGIDLKQLGEHVLVMEVNDNPSIEAGAEDKLAGERVYREIMRYFRKRLDARGDGNRAR